MPDAAARERAVAVVEYTLPHSANQQPERRVGQICSQPAPACQRRTGRSEGNWAGFQPAADP